MPVSRSVLRAGAAILREVLREGEGDGSLPRSLPPATRRRPNRRHGRKLSDRARICRCVAAVALTSCSPARHESGSKLAVEAVEWDAVSHDYAPLADGSDVHLAPPPQGGHVLFIGARVEGLSGNEIELTGRVRDLETDAILQEDTRTTTVQPMPDRSGFSETDPSSLRYVSNIALCPDYDAVDVAGRPCLLEVEATDRGRHATGSTRVLVTPICAQPAPEYQAFCECECQAGYTPGKCSPKAGTDGG